MNDKNKLVAISENIGFFFVRVLNAKELREIKSTALNLGMSDYVIHGFLSCINDSHFIKIEAK